MKNQLHRFITIFMSALVLLSSTGFAFVEHECMMRGKSVKFFEEKQEVKTTKISSCCARSKALKEAKGTFFKKTQCCKDSQKFEKVETLSSGAQLSAKFLKASQDFVPAAAIPHFIFLARHNLSDDAPALPDIPLPPAFYGRSMRCLIQSFQI
jgi:hypothetical protein